MDLIVEFAFLKQQSISNRACSNLDIELDDISEVRFSLLREKLPEPALLNSFLFGVQGIELSLCLSKHCRLCVLNGKVLLQRELIWFGCFSITQK